MEIQNTELAKIKIQSKMLKIREIHLKEVSKCLQLQDSLTELETHAFSKRTHETYTKIIKDGIAIGLFNESEDLVAQIATDLSTEKKPYIKSQNATIQSFLDQECYIEVGAAIVDKNYRGHGLLKLLMQKLEEQILKLISNENLLNQKNQKLQNCLKNKALFLVAGCNVENYASGLSFMNTGFSLIGNVKNTLNDTQEVQGYIFMKQITQEKKLKIVERKTTDLLTTKKTENPLPIDIIKTFLSEKSIISKNEDGFVIETVK